MVKKFLFCISLSVTILCFISCDLSSIKADFYVAPSGSDNNLGQIESPFATIQRAQKAVRQLIAQGQLKNIVVVIREGNYRLTEPLIFGIQDSGTDKYRIIYRAYPGEKPTISGGRIITDWQLDKEGDWVTKVNSLESGEWNFRELFVNGKRATRARHPNEGYFSVFQPGADRRTSFMFHSGEISNYDNVAEVELVYSHDWSISRIPLKSIDERTAQITLAFPLGAAERDYWMMWKNERYFLENSVSFLDRPGEWHFNRKTGILKYKPLPDEKIERVEAIVPVSEALIVAQGKEMTNQVIKNLHFEGITFEHCLYILPPKGYAGVQAAFHATRETDLDEDWKMMPAALRFESCEKISIKNCIIRNMGGSGIWFGRQTKNNLIAGNKIYDLSGNGIMIGEDRNRLIDGQSWWEASPLHAASNNIIQNNFIKDCGRQFFGSVGIWIGLAEKTLISHNEICYLPYTGISVGWMWNPTPTPCKKNIVENNHIHHIMQVLSDGGGIYTLGLQEGSFLRGNYIHDIPLNIGRAESNGMFLDEGSTGFIVENNLIYNIDRSPIRFHKAGNNLVRNNFLGVTENNPMIRYNNTAEENISKEDNIIFESKNIETIQHNKVEMIRKNAGLKIGL